MIPRHREPPPIEPSNVPQDAPKVEHVALDYEFLLTGGISYTFSIVDGYGAIDERSDRYVCQLDTERVEIPKASIVLLRVIERTFETEPAEWVPPVV